LWGDVDVRLVKTFRVAADSGNPHAILPLYGGAVIKSNREGHEANARRWTVGGRFKPHWYIPA
jgi:hypothetical protein